jgi:hypothetical protein
VAWSLQLAANSTKELWIQSRLTGLEDCFESRESCIESGTHHRADVL